MNNNNEYINRVQTFFQWWVNYIPNSVFAQLSWVLTTKTDTLKRQRAQRWKKAAWLPQLWFSAEWLRLHEHCSLLGANRRGPRECLGGNYILVFLCYGASLIQYSQTHWGGQRAISKPGHFLALPPQTLWLQHAFLKLLVFPKTNFKIGGYMGKLSILNFENVNGEIFICSCLIFWRNMFVRFIEFWFSWWLSHLLWYYLCQKSMYIFGMFDI